MSADLPRLGVPQFAGTVGQFGITFGRVDNQTSMGDESDRYMVQEVLVGG